MQSIRVFSLLSEKKKKKGYFSLLSDLQKDEIKLYFSYQVLKELEDLFSPFHISEDCEAPEQAGISSRNCDCFYFAEGIRW